MTPDHIHPDARVYRRTTEPMTYDWLHGNIPMARPYLTDYEVAGRVRMLMRSDLDHEGVCTLARDRIMALSKRTVELQKALDLALANLVRFEPPDSRAVSDEFVAMSAMAAGGDIVNADCHRIIDAALAVERSRESA
jgi:hypothetical protein